MKKSCTVVISHFESRPFLRACLSQIRKCTHPDIKVDIIIVDQSGDETHSKVVLEFSECYNVRVVRTAPLYSGYGLDHILRYETINTDYICQLHVDCVPINSNYLKLPITLIEENNLAFVGQLQFISSGKESIYPPSPIFCMAQCYNVAKTETYKDMSREAGFTRFHNRPRAKEGMTWKDNSWDLWAAEDYNARGSDDDVVAFHWEDKYREHNKLGLAISGYVEPSFCRLIEDVVLHFGSANEARGVLQTMPILYQQYVERINGDKGFDDELIQEMVTLARANRPPEMEILSRNYWDGKLKVSSPPSQELNNRIEQLKTI